VRARSCTATRSLSASTRLPARIDGWPLPVQPRSVSRLGNLVVFAARGGGGLYAMRLDTGRFGLLGPLRASDVPQLTERGVFYQDNEFKRDTREGVVRLKFVPTAGILERIAVATRPIRTGDPISSLSMDGARVALAVTGRRETCDRVLYWNVAWPPVQRVSAPAGPTCAWRERTAIRNVAIGGFRAEWAAASAGETRIVWGSPLCREWVVRRLHAGDRLTALAADGSTLAFAVAGKHPSVAVVDGHRALDIARGTATQLAVSGRHIAVLWADGTVGVYGVRGRVQRVVDARGARAIALDGASLIVLGRRTLRTDGRTFRVPSAETVDVQDGIAVLAAGRTAYAVDLRNGRTATIGRGTTPLVGIQIERPGAAYAFGTQARFVPTATLERLLGRSR
jgi:hypothetical protein